MLAAADDRLKGTKYLWTSSKEKVHPSRRVEFRFLCGTDLKTARVWAINENCGTCGLAASPAGLDASSLSVARMGDAEPTRADQESARMNERRLDNIITHCRHQLTNAVAERLNSKIMAIKRRTGASGTW